MTEIVYNKCYGGFGLSEAAVLRYAEIKGMQLYPEPHPTLAALGAITYWLKPPEERAGASWSRDATFDPDKIERDDPVLAQVVKELGEQASGRFANLAIGEVPAGMSYRIDEYDGFESVMTVNDYEWKVARD